MADLLDRLQTIAIGGSARLLPRPRGRFEPDADGRERPAWIDEEHDEIDAAPAQAAVTVMPTTDDRSPRASTGAAAVADSADERREASPAAGVPPTPASAPAAPMAPASLDATTTAVATAAVPEPSDPAELAPITAPLREVHTIREVDHVREVATVERLETASSVVELVRWVEEAPTEALATPPRPATAPAARSEADHATLTGTAVESGPMSAPNAVAAPADELAEAPSPRISVSIDRLEVRTAPEPRATPAVPRAVPEPVEFAGPTLDEFLGGVG